MKKYMIALYIRLSLEDAKTDSMSISSQRSILREYASELPEYANAELMEFVDNGYSGANFERPAVQELLDLVRANRIDCIMVKDFSRFGRNSLETGYFIERVFPLFHTRFISVNDDFDTQKLKGDTGGMEVAFKYLISEYYSRDMSVKTKTAKYLKFQRGEYQSKICPYGYRKGENGRMVPDPETSEVVQKIFEYAVNGMNAADIARELSRQQIPTPGEHKARKGIKTHDVSRTHGMWCNSTVLRILADERYMGTYVIGKREVTEIGGHKMRSKAESDWIKIPDHHIPLVNEEIFSKANASIQRFKIPNRKKHNYLLRGKVICGCCKHALHLANGTSYRCRFSSTIPSLDCYNIHIREKELNQLVLMDNNILACEYSIEQLAGLVDSGYRIDLNQGMDARLVTPEVADILARLKWISYLRFSCDQESQIEPILRTCELLKESGVKPYRVFVYLLVTSDLDNASRRMEALKGLRGINLYAQAERNESLGIRPNKAQLEFAQRYVYGGCFRRETWEEYIRRKGLLF